VRHFTLPTRVDALRCGRILQAYRSHPSMDTSYIHLAPRLEAARMVAAALALAAI
jgi:hypothetical protein